MTERQAKKVTMIHLTQPVYIDSWGGKLWGVESTFVGEPPRSRLRRDLALVACSLGMWVDYFACFVLCCDHNKSLIWAAGAWLRRLGYRLGTALYE